MSQVPSEVGNYFMIREIGRGSFASVWEAEHKLSFVKCAVKVVANSLLEVEATKKFFVRELAIMKKVDHPFITKLYEIITTDEFTFIVVEFAEQGTIMDWVNNNGALTEKNARRMFSQLLSALEYLHDVRFIAHRDLKAENVLLDRNLNIRLIDFGLSNTFTEEAPELSTACGSPAYAPPEMILGKSYTKAADMWSAGVLLFSMVSGELPFEGDTVREVMQKIAYSDPVYPAHLSPELVDLLRKLMMKDPVVRIDIEKVKAHPWFSRNEYKGLMSLQFAMDKKWLVAGVNREVIERIGTFGVDVKRLTCAVIRDEYTEDTAVYFMMIREEITDKIKQVVTELDSDVMRQKPVVLQDEESATSSRRDRRYVCTRRVSEESSSGTVVVPRVERAPRRGQKASGMLVPRQRIPTPVTTTRPPVPSGSDATKVCTVRRCLTRPRVNSTIAK